MLSVGKRKRSLDAELSLTDSDVRGPCLGYSLASTDECGSPDPEPVRRPHRDYHAARLACSSAVAFSRPAGSSTRDKIASRHLDVEPEVTEEEDGFRYARVIKRNPGLNGTRESPKDERSSDSDGFTLRPQRRFNRTNVTRGPECTRRPSAPGSATLPDLGKLDYAQNIGNLRPSSLSSAVLPLVLAAHYIYAPEITAASIVLPADLSRPACRTTSPDELQDAMQFGRLTEVAIRPARRHVLMTDKPFSPRRQHVDILDAHARKDQARSRIREGATVFRRSSQVMASLHAHGESEDSLAESVPSEEDTYESDAEMHQSTDRLQANQIIRQCLNAPLDDSNAVTRRQAWPSLEELLRDPHGSNAHSAAKASQHGRRAD